MTHNKPFLLIGCKGMLGRAYCELFEKRGIPYDGFDLPDFNIIDTDRVSRKITDKYQSVINCSAYTDVDGAELEEEKACTINATAVGHLAQQCRRAKIKLLHYSTDYVFDGLNSQPYRIDHQRKPLNAYGRTKAKGEELIERSGCNFLIIRTSWLYAPWGKNFVLTIGDLCTKKQRLSVVNDQRGRPTSALSLARNSLKLLEKNTSGIYHLTDNGTCTWFEFAQEITQKLNPKCDIVPCKSDEFPRPAVRPAYSVLDLSESEKIIGDILSWQVNLVVVLNAARKVRA